MSSPRNKFEQRINTSLRRAKIKYKYESEKIAYILACHYIPDFIIDTPTGKLYLECKGYLRPEDKRKLRAVKKQHPEMDIRLLFYAEKAEYVKWCVKNGFRYAFEKIPKDWLDGR